MKPIEFWKMNGSGNDFIPIDNRDGKIPEDGMQSLVKRVCRRRQSVGADDVFSRAWLEGSTSIACQACMHEEAL